VRIRGYAGPILAGLLIAAAGLIPWALLAPVNRDHRPDVPWAAFATPAYLAILLAWLHGRGWPRSTSLDRQRRLRLWPPSPDAAAGGSLSAGSIVGLLGILYVFWVVVGHFSQPPDLSRFPTTSYRWSMFIMGGVLSGVVEEAAYRGYMQTGLERHDPDNAIVITSLVFAASHVTQGLQVLLLLGPGLFAASLLYGVLARRTGTILPGMVIHVAGDLAYTYFGVLRGDGSLLFVAIRT
jgi:membrane protease YdiL (CAAX protease family)